MTNKIYCEYYTVANEEATPCIKYSVKNDFGAYENNTTNELTGKFVGAWKGENRFKEKTYNINIEDNFSDTIYVIQIKHFKPGYDFINIMSGVNPGEKIVIKIEKYLSKKDGKWYPSLSIGIDGDIIKEVQPSIKWTDYPRSIPLVNAKGQPILSAKGKQQYDSSEVIDFWDRIFDSIVAKFKSR